MNYALSTTVAAGFDETLAATRAALGEVGFGVLTEIDFAATLKTKLDVEIPAQVVLGACRPPLAHAALEAEPSIGLLLPCNVVVRAADAGHTVVEAIDPGAMVQITDNDTLAEVAADARERLSRALESLTPAVAEQP
jgi:uncharacterized protein (DUF302 family)